MQRVLCNIGSLRLYNVYTHISDNNNKKKTLIFVFIVIKYIIVYGVSFELETS